MDTSTTPQLDHQKIIGFKIWYSDKEITGYDYDDWVKAPDDDVQVVMVYFQLQDALGRHTRLYSSGVDNYAMTEDMQFTSSFDDPKKVKGHIKHGKYTHWKRLEKIEKTAFDDWGEGWLIPDKRGMVTPPFDKGGKMQLDMPKPRKEISKNNG